jgi:hypothetical protein
MTMWIIASLPLWIIGLLALALGLYGFHEYHRTHDPEDLATALVVLAIAAVVLPIAAKVAS